MESSATARSIAIEQNSDFGRVFWIGVYTTLLNILTLTLFRFWGITQFRRQLWKDTTVDGEPLEYIGKGSELFFGFLIASVVIGLPIGVFVLLTYLAAPPAILGLVYVVNFVLIYALAFAVPFLVRRYLLSRTMLRGVRFTQKGSASGFALASFAYSLLVSITAGWFSPVMRMRLAERLWGGTMYGDVLFAFNPRGAAEKEPVWGSFALSWFGIVLGVIGLIAAFALTMAKYNLELGPPPLAAILAFSGAALVIFLAMVVVVAWHEAVMLRWITKSISVDGASLSSSISTWDVIELSITNTLLIVCTLGLGWFAAEMRVWRRIARRLEAHGQVDYARIGQAASRGPRTGEGLADALDMGAAF